MMRNFASDIAGHEAGKNWVDRFFSRHTDDLKLAYITAMDRNRFAADSGYRYTLYFDLLHQKIEQYNVDPHHIYNMDEKGFWLGVLGKSKRVFPKQSKQDMENLQAVQDGTREWVTVLASICAGIALPPMLIFQSEGNIQDTWLQNFQPEKHNCFFAACPYGWTNNEIGSLWLKNVFNRSTEEKAHRAYRFLILDGHASHVNMGFIRCCEGNKILLAVFPPHATHTLQPLAVGMFGPLAQAYSAELTGFLFRCRALCSITKRDSFNLFVVAWEKSFTTSNILSAFQATGIQSLASEKILKKL